MPEKNLFEKHESAAISEAEIDVTIAKARAVSEMNSYRGQTTVNLSSRVALAAPGARDS